MVRKTVIECLMIFLKIAPRIDPIVKDLSTMIDGDKIDNLSKIEASEVLVLIISSGGKAI